MDKGLGQSLKMYVLILGQRTWTTSKYVFVNFWTKDLDNRLKSNIRTEFWTISQFKRWEYNFLKTIGQLHGSFIYS